MALMGGDELEAFLGQTFPTPLGVVGTLRHDGSPSLTPVWFRWDGASVKIWTTDSRVWVRNLQRDPRVAFSVQTFEAPYPAVVIRGRASLRSGDDAATVEEIRAITRRYVGPEEVETYISDWPALRTIVTIVPDRVTSWSEGG
ncbi:MAG: TIGR03618 family F420-dependent PPOX class oxidoreductase [Acidimicrobiales bacterium]